jgi:hypothetical protein
MVRLKTDPALLYIATIAVIFLVVAGIVAIISRGDDFLLAQQFPGVPLSYRAYNSFPHPEIQDRDVYFHNIGRSIEGAQKADIIILGHSVWFYGLDDEQVRAFNKKHGIRLFNMASAGNSSGDFIRAVIKRWDIHPGLWVINDDDEAVSFFNPGIDDAAATGSASSMQIVRTWRLEGFLHAFARNVRWSIGDLAGYLPESMRNRLFPAYASRFEAYRSIETGDWLFPPGTYYDTPGDRPFKAPARNCPASDAEISSARSFLADIGGTAILTLVPYARWCPQRVIDTAERLGLEAFLPPTTDYSNIDGRHMDRRGAKGYTAWFLRALEQSRAFAAITKKHLSADQ